MWFERYRRLGQRERALMDGRLITYCFYVGGATLLALGTYGISSGEPFSWGAVVFGLSSVVLGAALQIFHGFMVRSSHKDAYLVTISAAMGRQKIPLLPTLLAVLILFSLALSALYVLAD